MNETKKAVEHRSSTAKDLFLSYDSSTLPGISIYNLFIDDETEGKLPHLLAVVAVDLETRAVRVSTPDLSREIATNGVAAWKIDEKDGVERKRINGGHLAAYVLPRAARFLARLYVVTA